MKKKEWIAKAIQTIIDAAIAIHLQYHYLPTDPKSYQHCNLGSCGTINSLIKEAKANEWIPK